jgi:hypothetical protein
MAIYGGETANGVIACYDLTQDVEGRIVDRSGNGHDASSFYKRYEEPSDYAYSFAVVGDTQTAVWEDVNAAWTAANKEGATVSFEEALAARVSNNADLVNLVKAMYTYNVYADAYALS